MARTIAKSVRHFMTWEKDEGMKKSMYIRVELDITKPLLRVEKVNVGEGLFGVSVKYERLPNLAMFVGDYIMSTLDAISLTPFIIQTIVNMGSG